MVKEVKYFDGIYIVNSDQSGLAQVIIDGNYRLPGRVTLSSGLSLVFVWPTTTSRERLILGVALIVRETTGSADCAAVDDEGCSRLVESHSFALPFALDFCFAAFTLALVRKARESAAVVEEEESKSGT
jgi:hypothetical protein